MFGSMHQSATHLSPPTTLRSGNSGGSTTRTCGSSSSWARTTSTSTRSSSPRFNLVTAARGLCCTISLPLVNSFRRKSLSQVTDFPRRILELRGWQVLEESQSWRLWACSEGDRHPTRRVEVLLDFYKTGDSGCHVLME